MKTYYVSLLVAVLFVSAVSVNAQEEEECPKNCDYIFDPVCGYNGSCYNQYSNDCTLKVEQCTVNKDLKLVDMALCVEAIAKSNPEVSLCPHEE